MNFSYAYLATILIIVYTFHVQAADVTSTSSSGNKQEKFISGFFGDPWTGCGMGYGAIPGVLGCPGWLGGFGGYYSYGVTTWASTFGWGSCYGYPNLWFKSVGAGKDVARRSIDLSPATGSHIVQRDEAAIQCKNQKGEVHSFLRADCHAAAEKLVNQKAASATAQSCGLGLASKSGPITARSIPVEQLKAAVDKILGSCEKATSNQPAKRSPLQDEHSKIDDAHSIVVLLQKGEI